MSTTRAVTQTVLWIFTTTLQVAVALSWRQDDVPWFPTIFGLIIVSQMVLTVCSLAWVYGKMDFQGNLLSEVVCVGSHLLQLGPIWRCLKVAAFKDGEDVRELSALYLLLAIIRDGPFVVLQVFLLIKAPQATRLDVASVSVTFLALCLAHTCANVGPSKGHDISTSFNGLLKMCFCSTLHLVYRVLVLASRCLALGLFASAANWWVFLIFGLHTAIHWSMTVILRTARQDEESSRTSNILGPSPQSAAFSRYHLFSILEVFDLINIRDQQRDILEAVTFYCLVALQNATMAMLWFLKVGSSPTSATLLAAVFGSFVLGAAFCALRRSCARRVHRTISRKTSASTNINPLRIQTLNVLMGGPVIYDDGFMTKAAVFNVHDNRSSTSVSAMTAPWILDDVRQWDKPLSTTQRRSFQNTHFTQGLSLLDSGTKMITKTSPEGATVPATASKQGEPSSDGAQWDASPPLECGDSCLVEELAGRRSTRSEVLSLPMHVWGVETGEAYTQCSRTYCPQCASCSVGCRTCDETANIRTGIWPPTSKLALDGLSSLAEDPVDTERDILRWLEQIQAASQSAGVEGGGVRESPIPTYQTQLCPKSRVHRSCDPCGCVQAETRSNPVGSNHQDDCRRRTYDKCSTDRQASQTVSKLRDFMAGLVGRSRYKHPA